MGCIALKMFNKNKGFTLAEILGVIVIIGILLILIVPTILNRLNLSKELVHDTGESIIFDAAAQHVSENPSDYPPGKSGRYCISIQTLVEEGKLVNPVKDPSTGDDVSDKSVMVTIYSAGTADYELRDGNDCKELASLPLIDFDVTPKGSSWVPKRTVKIIWPAIDGDYRARYRVDNGEWQYVDSIDSRKGGTKELIFDKSAASRPLQAQYIGKGGDTGTSNIINSKINIINVDSIPPTCTLRLSGTMGNNSWYRSNVIVDFGNNNSNLKDDLSGVADYGISTSNSNSFGKVNKKTQTQDVAKITYYGYVKDKAGNIGKCNITFKKDATKPTCSVIDTGTKGDNNWYRSNVKLQMSTNDKMSGVDTKGMATKNSTIYNGTTQMTLSSDSKGITYYGFVKDKAGNTNSCSKSVKRDTTAPKCTLKASGTMGNNSWYRSNVTLSFASKTDATSGVSTYGMASNTSTSYNKKTSMVQSSDTSGITYYGFVKDKAGNKTSCSYWIKKDATKPTLTYTLRKINNGQDVGAAYSNQWSRYQIKRSFSPKDNLSGVAKMQYKTTGTSTWYDEGNVGSWIMNEGRNDASFRVIDNAGNVSSETRLILLVDWTPPTINFGISGYFTSTISCSDGNSGVNGSTYWTAGLSGTWNNTVNASCKDNAGNVRSTSHTYKYSSCRYTVNTCRGGYDSVWSNSANCGNYCSRIVTVTETTCIKMNVTNCRNNFPGATHSGGLCCGPMQKNVTEYYWCCKPGYVSVWNKCKYGSPNECRGGFSL